MKRSSFAQDVKSHSHPRTVWQRSLSNSLAFETADQQTAFKKKQLCQNRRGTLQILRNHQPIQMEPTCFSIKSGSLFSQFPHFITCEIPICVPDGPARVRFYWYAVFFFIFNGPCASSGTRQVPIGVDMCQQQLTFAENKTDVPLCPTLLLSVHAQWERGGKRRCLSGRFFPGK